MQIIPSPEEIAQIEFLETMFEEKKYLLKISIFSICYQTICGTASCGNLHFEKCLKNLSDPDKAMVQR